MFHKPGGPLNQDLSFDRTLIAYGAISFILWSVVLTKTYYGSKLPFVYCLSSILLLVFLLSIVIPVLGNWVYLGPSQKDIDRATQNIIDDLYWGTFFTANTL